MPKMGVKRSALVMNIEKRKNTKRTEELFVAALQYFLVRSEGEMCSRFSHLTSESNNSDAHPVTQNQYKNVQEKTFIVTHTLLS